MLEQLCSVPLLTGTPKRALKALGNSSAIVGLCRCQEVSDCQSPMGRGCGGCREEGGGRRRGGGWPHSPPRGQAAASSRSPPRPAQPRPGFPEALPWPQDPRASSLVGRSDQRHHGQQAGSADLQKVAGGGVSQETGTANAILTPLYIDTQQMANKGLLYGSGDLLNTL